MSGHCLYQPFWCLLLPSLYEPSLFFTHVHIWPNFPIFNSNHLIFFVGFIYLNTCLMAQKYVCSLLVFQLVNDNLFLRVRCSWSIVFLSGSIKLDQLFLPIIVVCTILKFYRLNSFPTSECVLLHDCPKQSLIQSKCDHRNVSKYLKINPQIHTLWLKRNTKAFL